MKKQYAIYLRLAKCCNGFCNEDKKTLILYLKSGALFVSIK
jgi:hypothetical protein